MQPVRYRLPTCNNPSYSLQKKKQKLLLKDSSSRNSEDQSKASSSASLSIRRLLWLRASALTYAWPEESSVMKPLDTQISKQNSGIMARSFRKTNPIGKTTARGTALNRPTSNSPALGRMRRNTYINMVTRLFVIAWSLPMLQAAPPSTVQASSMPYTKNLRGQGPYGLIPPSKTTLNTVLACTRRTETPRDRLVQRITNAFRNRRCQRSCGRMA